MWYFAWVLGVGFAILLAILNTLWGEYEETRNAVAQPPNDAASPQDHPRHDARPH